jgi:hypothetical protein
MMGDALVGIHVGTKGYMLPMFIWNCLLGNIGTEVMLVLLLVMLL